MAVFRHLPGSHGTVTEQSERVRPLDGRTTPGPPTDGDDEMVLTLMTWLPAACRIRPWLWRYGGATLSLDGPAAMALLFHYLNFMTQVQDQSLSLPKRPALPEHVCIALEKLKINK